MQYISSFIIPLIIFIVVFFGIKEKKSVCDIFIKGVKVGAKTVIEMFPTLLCLFIAIGALRTSGLIEFIIKIVRPITDIIGFPAQVLPLAILRPVSGSASMAIATDIMTKYGADTKIGLIASTIMGSTETTLYTIAIYTSCIKVRKIRFVLYAALFADIIGILTSYLFVNILY